MKKSIPIDLQLGSLVHIPAGSYYWKSDPTEYLVWSYFGIKMETPQVGIVVDISPDREYVQVVNILETPCYVSSSDVYVKI